MSVKSILVSVCIVAVGVGLFPATGTRAQTPETPAPPPPMKTFKLLHESATAAQNLDVGEETEKWVPGLQPGKVEVSMSLGFMNLAATLLQHEQMIYKYTTAATYWGDVEIAGQTAFNPVLRVGYTIEALARVRRVRRGFHFQVHLQGRQPALAQERARRGAPGRIRHSANTMPKPAR